MGSLTDASSVWCKPDVLWLAVEYNCGYAFAGTDYISVTRARTIAISSNKEEIADYIRERLPDRGCCVDPSRLLFARHTVGANETVERGDGSVVVAGDWGFASAGDYGRATEERVQATGAMPRQEMVVMRGRLLWGMPSQGREGDLVPDMTVMLN